MDALFEVGERHAPDARKVERHHVSIKACPWRVLGDAVARGRHGGELHACCETGWERGADGEFDVEMYFCGSFFFLRQTKWN